LEIAARERAEKKQQEYEERLRNMAEEMDRRQAELNEAQEMIRRLEEQLKQLQAAKEELENRQKVCDNSFSSPLKPLNIFNNDFLVSSFYTFSFVYVQDQVNAIFFHWRMLLHDIFYMCFYIIG